MPKAPKGRKVPTAAPKTLEEILKDANVSAVLSEVIMLHFRPKPRIDPYIRMLRSRLEPQDDLTRRIYGPNG